MPGSDLHGSWEISSVPEPQGTGGTGKAQSHNPGVHAVEKSDTPVVPRKPSNKGDDPAEMVESFYALRHDAAAGVDGVTWRDYEEGLYERVHGLHREIHTGAYRAKPSRRVLIPKADGRQRPLGIASLEDKVVQPAVVTVLNMIYEEDFLGFSYGFRHGRSQHDALAECVDRRDQEPKRELDY